MFRPKPLSLATLPEFFGHETFAASNALAPRSHGRASCTNNPDARPRDAKLLLLGLFVIGVAAENFSASGERNCLRVCQFGTVLRGKSIHGDHVARLQ